MGVTRHDLLHMDNTVQMHKDVGPPAPWKSMTLVHGSYRQRLYYLPGGGGAPPVPPEIMHMNTARPSVGGRLIGGGGDCKEAGQGTSEETKAVDRDLVVLYICLYVYVAC